MKPDQRIVTRIPLKELWDDNGTVDAKRIRSLDQKEIAEPLRVAEPRFAVADCGVKLRWLDSQQRLDFWKSVRSHIADPNEPFYLSNFPDEVAYFASEWRLQNGACVVLLEAHH